ncbi:auts2 [Pungitius sinensis]
MPQECRDNQAGPPHKKKVARVPDGLSLNPCKNNHHQQQPSDQENNPRLAHSQGKRKKKHLNKKHTMLKPGQNNCKGSDSESVSGECKPSIRSSSRDRLTDCDTESDQDDKPLSSFMWIHQSPITLPWY